MRYATTSDAFAAAVKMPRLSDFSSVNQLARFCAGAHVLRDAKFGAKERRADLGDDEGTLAAILDAGTGRGDETIGCCVSWIATIR